MSKHRLDKQPLSNIGTAMSVNLFPEQLETPQCNQQDQIKHVGANRFYCSHNLLVHVLLPLDGAVRGDTEKQ